MTCPDGREVRATPDPNLHLCPARTQIRNCVRVRGHFSVKEDIPGWYVNHEYKPLTDKNRRLRSLALPLTQIRICVHQEPKSEFGCRRPVRMALPR